MPGAVMPGAVMSAERASRWILVAGAWCIGAMLLAGCNRPKPGLELQVVVIGNAAPGDRAKRIDVLFDRPMVPSARLGEALDRKSGAPFRLQPDLPGTLRWREDRRLSFEPEAPLPRATEFVVTVPSGTRGLDDVGIRDDHQHRFETERLTLGTELVRAADLPDPKQWATPAQALRLSFNQPVDAAKVTASCRFRSEDGAISVATDVVAAPEAAREQIELAPHEPLRAGTSFRFACEGLSPVEGPLPLAALEAGVSADGQVPSGTLAFSTFGPFRAEALSPSGQAVSPDEGEVSVHFSTPPESEETESPIQLTPKPEHAGSYATVSGSDLVMRVGGLTPHTDYTVTVPAGLTDVFGQRLAEAFTGHFRTGAAAPAYSLDTGSWAVEDSRGGYVAWARNLDSIEVLAAAVSEEQLFGVLPSLDWWDRDAVDLEGAKIPFVRRVLHPGGEPDHYGQVLLSPKALLGKAAASSRFYYFASHSPQVLDKYEKDSDGKPLTQGYREVLLNVTNLGLTAKLSGNSGLVWVTRLSDGAAQPGAEVIVRARSGALLWRGTTGSDGTVSLPGRAALLAKDKVAKDSSAKDKAAPEESPSEEGEGEEESGEASLLIFARHSGDVTFVDPDAVGRYSGWSFGVENDTVPKEHALRGFLHTDRGLYRPGDTVHLRGLARLLELGGGLFVPPEAKAVVTVQDPNDREVARSTLPLSRFGGFSFDHVLPELTPLGDYRVRARLPHGEFSETFTVEEFRAATFEVKLEAKPPRAFAGEKITLSSLGRYFYGAPVRSADVTFRVHSRPRNVAFDGYEDFAFMDEPDYHDGTRPYGEEALITETAAKLNAEGTASVKVALPPEQFVSPSTLLVSATVQDETNQTVSANLTLPLHRTRLYLGIDSGGWVAAEKSPQRVRFVAVDPEGHPTAATARFIVQKQNWSCAWERWGYRGSYRCEAKPEVVAQGPLAISAGAPVEQLVVYPGPGEYRVSVDGLDGQKQPVRASRSVWVYGSGDAAWHADDSGRFSIIADRKEYHVGDTAKLIVQTATAGARALISVERDGVLSKRVLQELTPGQAIEVPISAALAPNAFVSVVLVRGRSGEGARGLPQSTMGLINLPVSHEDKRLQVALLTDRGEYRPGGSVSAHVRVTDAGGKPVQAEVALSAADEGVLSLIDFQTPDPLRTFFAPWGWAVKTTSQYERLTQLPAPDQERYVTGGDSAGMPGSFRSRFRASAYWNAAVVTDAAGEAEVHFDAPDNLTAFRLMAVAADAGDHFGSGERRFTVNKPLQLISALPRFASVGDHFEAAAMLTNETGQDGVAQVRFSVDGVVAAENGTALARAVPVPAAGRVRVAFPVHADAAGNARFRFAATLGSENDGLELNVPVQPPGPEESELLSAGATDKQVALAVRFPEGVQPGSAQLQISVDPDGLAGIEDGLRELVQYPYGCLEQTTSRLIPLIAARELTRSLKLPELEGDRLEGYIRIAIAKIGRHQDQSGGFRLWPGSPPDTYLTAYALWGLKLASDAGYTVDAAELQRGVDYVRQGLAAEPPSDGHRGVLGELSSRAFALHVLALLGQPDAAAATALAAQADALPRYGQAFLARALAAAVGPTHESVKALLDRIEVLPSGSGEGLRVNERTDPELSWYFNSNLRSSAIFTDTLLALRPDDAHLPGLIRGLLEARRANGSWYNTQEDLYALVALSSYAKTRAGKGATVRITRGDDTVLSERLSGGALERLRRVQVTVDPNDKRPLSVAAIEGTVHYRVRTSYRRDADHQPAANQGLELVRTFLDPETGAVIDRAREGQMVRVRLTLSSATEQSYVALSDYLPAGLEPINTRFATVPNNLPPDDPDWRSRLWLTHRDLTDSRVNAFVDWLPARPGSFEYLARATSVGKFVVPSATAQKMYDPDVQGRTALRRFEVVARP
ncbi:MAG: MG2 domain-containing protein [Deltaproteobacteria bacterium]